jgi:hypothetical protein
MTAALDTKPLPRDDGVMPTPSDLRALRTLLGYSRDEMARLLDAGGRDGRPLTGEDIRKLERARTWFVSATHVETLEIMLARVNIALDEALQGEPPKFLIAFPNDGAFRDYAPAMAEWMHYNSAHLMFTARLLDGWMVDGHRPEVMELVPASYAQFRNDRNAPDNDATRLAWAADYRTLIKQRSGLLRPERENDDA